MLKKPKIPNSALAAVNTPAPTPKAIPVETSPDVRTSQIEAERGAVARKGRRASLLTGRLGDYGGGAQSAQPGAYGSASIRRVSVLGG